MDPFYGEIRIFGFGFAPAYWAQCNGQTVQLQQYQTLFTVLGVQYGGNGSNTFMLPNLRGSTVAQQGQGTGLTDRVVGDQWGTSFVTLNTTQIPTHQHAGYAVSTSPTNLANEPTSNAHIARTNNQFNYSAVDQPDTIMALQSLGPAGNGTPHENRQPYLAMNFCICLQGVYPMKS